MMGGDFDKSDNSQNAEAFRERAMKKNLGRIEPLLNTILHRIHLESGKGYFTIELGLWDSTAENIRMTDDQIHSLNLELRIRGLTIHEIGDNTRWSSDCKHIDTSGRGISMPAKTSRHRQHFRISWGM